MNALKVSTSSAFIIRFMLTEDRYNKFLEFVKGPNQMLVSTKHDFEYFS